MKDLADRYEATTRTLAAVKDELAQERTTTAALRRVVAELALELAQAHQELRAAANVPQLSRYRP